MIGKNGEIHKSNAGDHRFFTARIIGVPTMLFTIKGVHKNFMEKHEIPYSYRGIDKLIQVIKSIESK